MSSPPLSAILVAGPELGGSTPLLADKWDPNRRDYASLDEGMDPIDAHVVHSLYVQRGTGASVLDTGIDPMPNKMTDTLEQEASSAVRRALARLLTNGDIRLTRVGLRVRDDGNQTAEIEVRYVNLRADTDRIAIMRLPAAPVEV